MRLRQRKTEKINEEEEMDLRKMFLFVCLFALFPNDSTPGVDSNFLALHDIFPAKESVVVVVF